ncbi:hypothetical protein COU54_01540 [Candidatus Pacearchaeota archaeon CG10_big_fil_rev_8_21_14_0_10_31_24]|nr:MAG: hypothetical protein COU54_01540 [Candidatus Pacearchaeota archaeon CG10_big_fil_rev_8_21_14_0_10_31_24]
MSFKEFVKELNGEGVEGELIKTIFVSLITSFLVLFVLYYFKLKYVEEFIPKYGLYLFFIILSYAFILPSVRQVRAYQNFPCMSGMMIGMTVGMIAGFLAGFFVGATNGMFWGSVFGMGIGILFGVWNGKCCGVMGIMEGMMAGFMGGLMGAMTAIMMFNDNLKALGIIVFIISASIMIGLNFMIYSESKMLDRKHKDDELFIVFWSFILTMISIWLMVFGPRSVLFQ